MLTYSLRNRASFERFGRQARLLEFGECGGLVLTGVENEMDVPQRAYAILRSAVDEDRSVVVVGENLFELLEDRR